MTLRKDIAELVGKHCKKAILPQGKCPVSGKVFDEEELIGGIEAIMKGWWTEGEYSIAFENELKKYVGTTFALAVNSGSSANLVAFYALTSSKLGNRRIKKGDEVITAAAAFPTTVNPIIQYGAVPVFLDVEPETYSIDFSNLEEALSPKTKAIFVAHTLGNPFDLKKAREFADEHGLWLIEDNCDALGSLYAGMKTGSFGHLSTLSFYPAHHITSAEGGAVLTSDPILYKIARSFRDWGRDCWCPTGQDNTCKKRFSWKLGKLPFGYDHKYVYSECGFNLKMTDIQAAIGLAQMKKLDGFCQKRRGNFAYLKKRFAEEGLESQFVLPEATTNSDPCWFGFPLTIKGGIERAKLLQNLDAAGVGSRMIFAGNITKQPYFINDAPPWRAAGKLKNTDVVMERSFWLGLYPALSEANLEHTVMSVKKLAGGS